MATITWKGEPGGPNDEGAKSIEWGGKTFKRGEAVEVDASFAGLEKAKTNPFFEVSGADAPADEPAGKSVMTPDTTYKPPSQQPAQYSVPKPGEPVKVPMASPQAAPKTPPRV